MSVKHTHLPALVLAGLAAFAPGFALPADSGESLMRAGDRCFVEADYACASRSYRQASALSSRTQLRVRLGVALTAEGSYAAADSAFALLRAEPGRQRMAAFYLGNVRYAQHDYEAALNNYAAAQAVPDTACWYAAALAGRAICAERLGYVSMAGQYRRDLERRFPGSLEKKLFAQGFAPFSTDSSQTFASLPSRAPATASTDASGSFTVQVGSFATIENATRTQEKLLKEFDGVLVSAGQVEARTYYRVRMGSFTSEEEAEAFAKSRLAPRGIDYKVIKQ
jgi:tetratricopeptide (TPR) repeat protein